MSKALAALGRLSASHRWVVVAVWVVILGAFTAVTATSMNLNADSSAGMPATQASKALTTMKEKFGTADSSAETLTLVLQTKDGQQVTDKSVGTKIETVLARARDLPNVTSVSDPLNPKTPFVSESLTTVVSTLTFDGITDDNRDAVYNNVVQLAEAQRGTFTAEVGGSFSDTVEVPGVGVGEIVGVIAAFLVLILTFGTLRVAGANMLVAVSGVAVGTVGVLAYSAINPLQSTIITLVTMLGLAVGIDYNLFVLSRFRTELKDGRGVMDAIGRATGTAGTAVFFAGLTVMIALAGLSLTGIAAIRDMGLAGAFGVLIAVLMAVTLMPVLLRTLGFKALSAKERRALAARTVDGTVVGGGSAHDDLSAQPRRRILRGWANGVTKHPILSGLAAVVVLVIMALPMFGLKTASSIPGGNDPDSTQRHAYNLVLKEFGGVQSPLLVLVEGDGVSAQLAGVQNELKTLPDVQMVVPGTVNAAGDTALVTVIPSGGPLDQSTKDLVSTIRDRADETTGVHLEVTGETAIGIDTDAMLQRALVTYVIVIVVISVLLLMVLFRSLLIPLVATAGYLLSLGVTFGASVAIFQWGWIPLPAPQGDPMLNILPIILTGVLFGLAMDYQVFLVSRIREGHSQGLSPKEAIVSGFVNAGPVLVAAASIMALVFAGFATSTLTFAASTAAGITVGVLADAFLVRMVVMPAALALLGKAAWWMPGWLDRILPHVDAEGSALDSPEPAEPARELQLQP